MEAVTRGPIAVVRQVFGHWSIAIPPWFLETFVEDEAYWHAWDDDRSVSLSSVVVDDVDGPVAAESIIARFPAPEGRPMAELPSGLKGWAVEVDADPSARASRALCGMLATDGRVLLATITSDDRAWTRRTWLSIRRMTRPPGRDDWGTSAAEHSRVEPRARGGVCGW
jgi:hypothetical protein